MTSKISPCLWFDTQAEEAARFYTSVFKESRIVEVSRYPAVGQEIHGKPAGSVMVVVFELNGQRYTALNGGPDFKFNEAISLQVECEDQAEVDYYWKKLSDGGDPASQQCGWLEDKFGLSWQIVPKRLRELMRDPDPEKVKRVFGAMLHMKKMDIAALERAARGD